MRIIIRRINNYLIAVTDNIAAGGAGLLFLLLVGDVHEINAGKMIFLYEKEKADVEYAIAVTDNIIHNPLFVSGAYKIEPVIFHQLL